MELSLLQLQEPTHNSFPNKNDYVIAMKVYKAWLHACKEALHIGKPHEFTLTFGPKVTVKDNATSLTTKETQLKHFQQEHDQIFTLCKNKMSAIENKNVGTMSTQLTEA